MAQVIKFPGGPKPVPYWCGKPMETLRSQPRSGKPKLVHDVAEIYSEIPADLNRGQAAFVYVSTVLQFSRQILRELSDDDLAHLGLLVDAAGEAGRSPNLDEIDILGDMVNDEIESRGGDNS